METIEDRDFGSRAAELLHRLADGEAFEITANGKAIGRLLPATRDEAVPPAGRTFNDWLLNGPRIDDLDLPDRGESPMRDPGL